MIQLELFPRADGVSWLLHLAKCERLRHWNEIDRRFGYTTRRQLEKVWAAYAHTYRPIPF